VSRKWKFRRLAVSSLLALSALGVALPVGAQGISAADALKQVPTLRAERRDAEVVRLLTPFAATTKDAELLRLLGVSQRELRGPANCLKAVEWYTKSLELRPNHATTLGNRAGAYDCLGRPYLEERLADRQRQVEIGEAASPTKTASAGAYSDLAGAHNALVAPTAESVVDLERAKLVRDLHTKAIALDNSRIGNLRDRGELMRVRFVQPGAAANDFETALELVRARPVEVVENARQRGITARRLADQGVETIKSMLFGAETLAATTNARTGNVTVINRVPAATIAQLRNEALTNYNIYIQAFEGKERGEGRAAAFADTRFGAGSLDIADAYADRAALYRNMNKPAEALADLQRRVDLAPDEPNFYWDLAQQYDRMDMDSGTRNALAKFFQLVGNGPNNNAGAARALLTRACMTNVNDPACR